MSNVFITAFVRTLKYWCYWCACFEHHEHLVEVCVQIWFWWLVSARQASDFASTLQLSCFLLRACISILPWRGSRWLKHPQAACQPHHPVAPTSSNILFQKHGLSWVINISPFKFSLFAGSQTLHPFLSKAISHWSLSNCPADNSAKPLHHKELREGLHYP